MLVLMTHEELPGVEKTVDQLAYRYAWFPEGWRSEDDPDWEGPSEEDEPPLHVRDHRIHPPFTGRVAVATEEVAVDALFAFDDPIFSVGLGATLSIEAASAYKGVLFNPTIIYESPSPITGGRSFETSAILRNPPGVAQTIPHNTDFYANTNVVGDGAALAYSGSAFRDAIDLSVANGGTLTATRTASHESILALGAGVTVPSRRGYVFADATGAGTLTEQCAVDIATLAKGATNIGIRNASTQVDTPSVATISSASSTIAPNARVKRLNNTSGGAVTLTATPIIADGQDGQVLELMNGSANSVTLTHGTNNNLRLDAGTNKTLAQRASILLRFYSAIGDWVQVAPVSTPS